MPIKYPDLDSEPRGGGGGYSLATSALPVNLGEQVASELAYDFFREGRFNNSTGPIEVPGLIQAAGVSPQEASKATGGFGAIVVQAVGFEEGTDVPTVHLYLTRGTTKQIKDLPTEVRGATIISHKMGPINVRPELAGASTNQGHIFVRHSAVCCGSSCGPTSEASAGTLGALIKVGDSSPMYILSNNHVLAGCNHVPRGQPILAPASMDGRPLARAPGEIARHDQIIELRSGHPDLVSPCVSDLALAAATNEALLSSWQGDAASGYDTPSRWAAPLTNLKVKKVGRTTGLTTGLVQAKVSVPTPISYNSKHFKGVVWFKGVWTVKAATSSPFALPGDSGSLIVSEDGTEALGVLFAANATGEFAWMIPMACIEAAFGQFSLISKHNI